MCPQLLAVFLATAVSQAEPLEPMAPAACPESSSSGSFLCDWFGPMPQTCYQPRYGCYPGNSRFTNRYPAFHGYYYRAPYNYRQLSEYPWHAAPHEPLPFQATDLTTEDEAAPLTSQSQPAGAPRPSGARAKTVTTHNLAR